MHEFRVERYNVCTKNENVWKKVNDEEITMSAELIASLDFFRGYVVPFSRTSCTIALLGRSRRFYEDEI